MTKKYQSSGAGTSVPVLPERVSISLEEVADDLREGLLALAVGAGLQVMQQLMAADVEAVCGPKGRHDPGRVAVRHGTEAGSVTLGGRRVSVRRPRVRSVDGGGEVGVPSYEVFTGTEVLGRMALERMLAGISTRNYGTALEPVGRSVREAATGTSKSAISRRFVAMTETALAELMGKDLTGLRLAAIMIDGVYFAEHLCVVALGIDTDGVKHPLALIDGSTENTTTVTALLVGLRERGLDVTAPVLAVLDGAKALTAAVHAVFDKPVIQRCQLHKIRNVTGHLPQVMRVPVERRMRAAYRAGSALAAQGLLEALAGELERTHPSAAGSLREGMTETLTVLRLDVKPSLARTLRSTNAIESMISIARDHSRNVKRWRDAPMTLRWCAAGMALAATQFRRVNGRADIPHLLAALDTATTTSAVTPTCNTAPQADIN